MLLFKTLKDLKNLFKSRFHSLITDLYLKEMAIIKTLKEDREGNVELVQTIGDFVPYFKIIKVSKVLLLKQCFEKYSLFTELSAWVFASFTVGMTYKILAPISVDAKDNCRTFSPSGSITVTTNNPSETFLKPSFRVNLKKKIVSLSSNNSKNQGIDNPAIDLIFYTVSGKLGQALFNQYYLEDGKKLVKFLTQQRASVFSFQKSQFALKLQRTEVTKISVTPRHFQKLEAFTLKSKACLFSCFSEKEKFFFLALLISLAHLRTLAFQDFFLEKQKIFFGNYFYKLRGGAYKTVTFVKESVEKKLRSLPLESLPVEKLLISLFFLFSLYEHCKKTGEKLLEFPEFAKLLSSIDKKLTWKEVSTRLLSWLLNHQIYILTFVFLIFLLIYRKEVISFLSKKSIPKTFGEKFSNFFRAFFEKRKKFFENFRNLWKFFFPRATSQKPKGKRHLSKEELLRQLKEKGEYTLTPDGHKMYDLGDTDLIEL